MKRLAPALVLAALALPSSAFALADLTGTAVEAPPMVFADRPATFSFTIMNIGDAAATDFVYRLYLSENRVVTITDTVFFESELVSLGAGETQDVTVTATPPAGTLPGDYYVGLILDPSPDNVVDDPNLNNNIKRTNEPIPLRLPAPDLTVSEVRLPIKAAAGENVPVTFTMENRGNEDASFDYGVYLSSNPTISTQDVLLFERSRNLSAGQQVVTTDYVRLALGLPPGPYYIGLVMDPNGGVAELDETNNVRGSAAALQVLEPALAIRTSFLPEAVLGVPFDWRMSAVGGTGDYVWSIAEGALPDGLSLDPATGAVTGTPETVGWFSFVVNVSSGSLTAATGYSMLVTRPTVSLMVQTSSLPPALLQDRYETRLIATGGVPPYTWTAEDELPAGMRLESDGLLTGEPRVVGGFSFGVQVKDARGSAARATLAVQVVDQSMLTISTGLLPLGQIGQAYIAGFDVLGGQSPYTWTLVGGELPPGLALDSTEGVLSGSPNEVGRFEFRLQVVDANGLFDTNTYAVQVIAQPVSIITMDLDAAEVGQAYSRTFNVLPSSGLEPFTWQIESGSLPEGLALDGETGVLAGTPAEDAAGTYTFVVGVQDARGAEGRRVYVLEVTDPARAALLAQDVEPQGGCASARGGAGLLTFLAIGLAGLLFGRRRRAGAALVAFLAIVPAGRAAAWNYSVAHLNETYHALPTGQVLSSISGSDENETNLQLPFSFDFYGVSYNNVGVSTNGLLVLGGMSSSYSTNAAIPATSSPDAIIAPWWDDLDGSDTTASEVLWAIEGSVGSRAMVIEFRDWNRYNGGTLNFQVRLYEGTGRIKFSYGAASSSASDAPSNATVGIEDGNGLSGAVGMTCTPTCSEDDWQANTAIVFSTEADLTVEAAGAPSVTWGSVPVQLSATVANVGGESSASFKVQAALSTDEVFDPADTLLTGSATVSGLASGQTKNISFVATIPDTVEPEHQYYLFVIANPEGTTREAQLTNNASQPVPIHIGAPVPNFRVSIPTSSETTVAPGQTVDVEFRIANSGNAPGQCDWAIVLSNNEIISTDDLALDESAAPVSVDALSVVSFTRPVTIPDTIHEGVYHLGVIADPSSSVSEPDEVDNAAMMVSPLTVATGSVRIVTSALPAAQVGRPYEVWLDAAGGNGSYRWGTVGGTGTLPPGLTLGPDGLLSGVPETAGEYQLQLLVRSGTETTLGSITILVSGYDSPLTVVTETLPPAVFGAESASQLVAVGGTPPYTWTVTSGTLPTGLYLLEGGLLGGIALESGDFAFTVEAKDAQDQVSSKDLDLTVVDPANLLVVTLDLPPAKLGSDYSATLRAVGGTPPYRWALETGSRLPAGLALDPDTGVISGSPEETGVFDVSVVVRDAREIIDSNTLTLSVGYDQGITIVTGTLPVATYGAAYEATVSATGGTAPYTWSLVGGSLPTGLELDPSGVIAGTPPQDTESRVVPFILQAKDATGRIDARGFSVRLAAAPPVKQAQGCSTSAGSAGPGAALFALLVLGLRRRRRR